MKKKHKKNRNFNKNQTSFYFEDYLETNKKNKYFKENNFFQDRLYLLFFLFFSLILIFSIRIVHVSLYDIDLYDHNNSPKKFIELMRKNNPLVVPRNHKVEEALDEANKGNLKPFNRFLEVLNKPYIKQRDVDNYQVPSKLNEEYKTFCGT